MTFKRCRISAHSLKGVAVNVGAEELAHGAGLIQKAVDENNTEVIIDLYGMLDDAFESFQSECLKY